MESFLVSRSAGKGEETEGSPPTPPRWDLSYPRGTLDRQRTVLESPIGGVGVEIIDDAVCRVTFAASGSPAAGEPSTVLAKTLHQLQEYFAGDRTDFDLPLVVRQGSEFERAVWAAIA